MRWLIALIFCACTGEIDGAAPTPDAAVVTSVADAALPDAAAFVDAPSAPDAAVDAAPNTCPKVAHIGDSLTAFTVEPLRAAYLAVGTEAQIDAFGGRAILQKLPDDPKTGKQAALDFRAAGFDGCWVVALGTNDTANVAAGSSYTRAQAIDEMMMAVDPAKKARVLWVNLFTTRTTGFYQNANMILFNEALEDARGRWPNLVIFDWAAIAAGGSAPYIDGIHHTTAGYTVRNAAIAGALRLLPPP